MVYHLGVLLLCAVVTVQVLGFDPCTEHCICDDSSTTCLECEIWYVRNDQGMCAQYIENVLLENTAAIISGENDYVTLSVEFYQQDLDIDPYTQDYYYYTVQYKQIGTSNDFSDSTFYKHFNGDEGWREISATDLMDNTMYELRVALYKMFPLRSWKSFLDATDTVMMTTKCLIWHAVGQYEFMSSEENNINRKPFTESEQFCNILGGNLASVTSIAEHNVIGSSYSCYQYWIGLIFPDDADVTECNACYRCAKSSNNTDCAQCALCRDKWQWTDGSPVQLTFWEDGYPYSSKCAWRDCMHWISQSCSYDLYYLCKRERNTTQVISTCATTTTETSTLASSSSSNTFGWQGIIAIIFAICCCWSLQLELCDIQSTEKGMGKQKAGISKAVSASMGYWTSAIAEQEDDEITAVGFSEEGRSDNRH